MRTALVLLALALMVGPALVQPAGAQVPASAQPGPTTAPNDPAAAEKAQRDAAKARQDEVFNELGDLAVTDDQLAADLDRIESLLRQQGTKAKQAKSDKTAADEDLVVVNQQLAQAEIDAVDARRDAAKQAVEAYMRPNRETATQVLAVRDPQQIGNMRALVRDVAEHNQSIVERRAAAQYLLDLKRTEAGDSKAKATRLNTEAATALADTTRLRQEQTKVRGELEKRMNELKDESEALQAQEETLTQLIDQREEQARLEAEAQAAADAAAAEAARVQGLQPPASAAPRAPVNTNGKRFAWPLIGPMTSPFGPRAGAFHPGIDIGVVIGTEIHAAGDGVVFFSGWMDGYGNAILIDHGGGLVSLYGHQSKVIATNGQRVTTGQLIGLSGNTGNSTGPHLHFEVRLNGTAVDPRPYLP